MEQLNDDFGLTIAEIIEMVVDEIEARINLTSAKKEFTHEELYEMIDRAAEAAIIRVIELDYDIEEEINSSTTFYEEPMICLN